MSGNSSSTRAATCALPFLLLGAFACGDDPRSIGGGPGGGTAPDAGVPADAALPDTGGGGTSGFVSNTPGATLVDVGATPNAVLLSSNVLQQPSGNEIFQEWLGEMKNTGSTVLCLASVNVSLRTAAGTEIASFFTFADGDPYMSSTSALSVGCLAPGQIGGLYDNGFVATDAQLSAVTRIEVRFTLTDFPGVVPSPHAPLIASQQAPVFGEFGLSGTLTGVGGAIYNIGFTAYPRAASGLVVAQLFATDLDTLPPGSVFSFTTISTPTPFTDYRQFADFIDGPKPAAPVAAAAAPALPGAFAAIDAARRAQRDAVRARAARARGH